MGILKFDWVVNIKPVGNGEAVLKYLAPYVYRVAISDNRILSVDDRGVAYRVKPSGTDRHETRWLDGESFVRAFAQHILPPRFMKVRYYGFMSSNSKLKLARVRWLIWLWLGWTLWLSSLLPKQPDPVRKSAECRHCGGKLILIGVTDGAGTILWRRQSRGPPDQSQIERFAQTQLK